MSAYAIHDRIEQGCNDDHQAQIKKDAWIDARANELLAVYPDKLTGFADAFSLPFELRSHFYGAKAQEAYLEFIHVLAWQQAADDWELAFGWSAQ